MQIVDRRFTAFTHAFIVQCEEMCRSLEAKLNFTADRNVAPLRKPPLPAGAKTFYRLCRGYLNDRIEASPTDRPLQISTSSRMTLYYTDRSMIDALLGIYSAFVYVERARRHRS